MEPFKAGRTELTDEKRAGRPRSFARDSLTREVKLLLKEEARLAVRDLADRVDGPPIIFFEPLKKILVSFASVTDGSPVSSPTT